MKQEALQKLHQDFPPPELDALYVPELDPQIKQTEVIMHQVLRSKVDKELRASSQLIYDISGPLCRPLENCHSAENGYVNALETAKLACQALRLTGHAVSVINAKRRNELISLPSMAGLKSALNGGKEPPQSGKLLFGPNLAQRVVERKDFSKGMKELNEAEKNLNMNLGRQGKDRFVNKLQTQDRLCLALKPLASSPPTHISAVP